MTETRLQKRKNGSERAIYVRIHGCSFPFSRLFHFIFYKNQAPS